MQTVMETAGCESQHIGSNTCSTKLGRTFHVSLFAVTLAHVSEGAFPEMRLRLPFERRQYAP